MKDNQRHAVLRFENANVEEVGEQEGEPLTLGTELISPRPGVPLCRRIRLLPSENPQTNPMEGPLRSSRILFKETLHGDCGVGVFVRRNELGSPLHEYFHSCDMSPEHPHRESVGELHTSPISPALQTIADMQRANSNKSSLNSMIGVGMADLEVTELHSKREVRIPLRTPVSIRNPEPDPHPEQHTDYEEYLRRSGEQNGFVEISVMEIKNGE